ncbi:MAG: hypothetical protein KF718_05905 [Polyangiaceae bacterium]|nr:hypothetical protein [Polyangiaceae bacterium]
MSRVVAYGALLSCAAPQPVSSFECDSSGNTTLVPGVCASQFVAFETCYGS